MFHTLTMGGDGAHLTWAEFKELTIGELVTTIDVVNRYRDKIKKSLQA